MEIDVLADAPPVALINLSSYAFSGTLSSPTCGNHRFFLTTESVYPKTANRGVILRGDRVG